MYYLKENTVNTTEELLNYITNMSSAYRRSYKLLSNVNKCLIITIGFLGSTAFIGALPMVPIAISVFSIIAGAPLILKESLGLRKKISQLKKQYQSYMDLISYIRCNIDNESSELIKEVFLREREIQKTNKFVTPLEKYLQIYKLGGYS